MITHVAERGENRGRVVLQTSPAGPLSPIAVEAALLVAKAFGSEIEGLFVEDEDLAHSTQFSFVKEVAFSGRETRPLSLAALESAWAASAREAQGIIVGWAGDSDVPVHFHTVRGRIDVALARACATLGPWNLIAIGEPLERADLPSVGHLLSVVYGTTGILAAGARASRVEGPVVALVESVERVPPMWRAAERIAAVTGAAASLVIVNEEPANRNWLEGQVRLALASERRAQFAIADAPHGEPAVIAELLRQAHAGLVILQYGGLAVPNDAALKALCAALEGAVLVVR